MAPGLTAVTRSDWFAHQCSGFRTQSAFHGVDLPDCDGTAVGLPGGAAETLKSGKGRSNRYPIACAGRGRTDRHDGPDFSGNNVDVWRVPGAGGLARDTQQAHVRGRVE